MSYAKFILPAMLLLVPLSGGQAEDGKPTWLLDLTHQLMEEQKCEVAFYVRVRDEKGDGSGNVEARARCQDGREFDAVRDDPLQQFVITACGVAVCEAIPDDKDHQPG
ncbi:MAG: hypothetical protein AAGE89_01905 [Pseudomonadota bacterium]